MKLPAFLKWNRNKEVITPFSFNKSTRNTEDNQPSPPPQLSIYDLVYHPVVGAALTQIANATSFIPCKWIDDQGNNINNPKLTGLFPNESEIWEFSALNLIVNGNTYGYVSEGEYIPLVNSLIETRGQQLLYRVDDKEIILDPNFLIHSKYLNPFNKSQGLSALLLGKTSIELDSYALRYNRALLVNSATPGGILRIEGTVTPEVKEEIKRAWKRVHQGLQNTGEIAVMESDSGEWIDTSKSSRDMEFIALRKMNREEILACLGVPPMMVGLGTGSYSEARQQRSTFYLNSILPLMKRIDDAITQWIRKQGIQAHLTRDTSSIDNLLNYARDSEIRENYFAGLITLQEARTQMGLEPLDESQLPGPVQQQEGEEAKNYPFALVENQ